MTSPQATTLLTPVLRRRLLLVAGLVFTLWATWKVGDDDTAQKPLVTTTPARKAAAKSTTAIPTPMPTLVLEWPERVMHGEKVVDIFSPPPPPLPVAATPTAPVLPVLGLKYMGRLDGVDTSYAYLADANERLFAVKSGQDIDNGWRLNAMDSTKLTFRHMASGHEQTILTGATQ